jgi:hypothetical protein
MGADEVGTLRALKAIRRELADPAIAAHHGRIVKTTGDGILIEIPSVVDAVVCAVAIQGGMVTRNASVPEDKRIVFRIGINIGDIIIDEADIHGDSVNVAARLEGLADPGSIHRRYHHGRVGGGRGRHVRLQLCENSGLSSGGMVSPSALAVVILMTNSNFVGCSTGDVARLRFTYVKGFGCRP